MSQYFNNKGYGEYFKSLEQDLEKNENAEPLQRKSEYVSVVKKRKKKKRLFKVIRLKKSVIAVFLCLCLVALSVWLVPFDKIGAYISSFKQEKVVENTDNPVKTEKEEFIEYKFTDSTKSIPSSNDAKAAIIIDKSNDTVIASRNAHTRLYPASTTKVMTLLVAVERITDLQDTFTMTLEITDPLFQAGASVAGFLENEEITMKDLLYGMILPSGADGAMGLAVKISGSEAEFVKLMNEKVKELGLKNTNFTNVTGLHHENNYSTVYDMAIILDAALKNPLCKEILSTYQYTTTSTKKHPDGILLSSTLFSYMYGTEPKTATILGGKTGFVNESGYCIASYGKANETQNEYIIVTFGNSSRWPAFYGQIDLYKDFAK